MKDSKINIRIDSETKERAEKTLKKLFFYFCSVYYN